MTHLAKVLGVLVLALGLHGCSRRRDEPSPGARNAHAMAYDAKRQRVTLFGGADERSVRGDTWNWDGRKWQLQASDGPPPRTFPVMAYDAARERVLLFGGNRVLFGTDRALDTLLRDLWAWDGRQWVEIGEGVDGPSARAEACGAYDEERHRLVIFGGYEKTGATIRRLGDTWEWDGTSWSRVAESGPSARSGAAMAYVPARRGRTAGVVLFGGSTGTPPPQGDTWHWNGHVWKLLAESAQGSGRFNTVMAYDSAEQALLRFGGWTGKMRVNELWKLDDHGWVQVGDWGPAGRNHSAWVYDAARRSLVLHGGHDGDRVFADTWTWDGVGWTAKVDRSPLARIDNGH
jgi:hypothetical protein